MSLTGALAKKERRPAHANGVAQSLTTTGGSAYGRAALEGETAELASTPEGQRNDRLNRAAFRAGQLVAGGELDELEAVGALRHAANACGLDELETSKTLASGMAAGKQEPRSAPPRATSTRAPRDRSDDWADDLMDPGNDGDAPAELPDRNGEAANEQPEPKKPEPEPRRPVTPDEVIAQWLVEGRLIHEPTGIARLDELTGGGPVYGSRWYLAGAPDAGKTALMLQIGHKFAHRGVAVGLLAVDEEDSDIVTRLAQRLGYDRIDCEVRQPETLATIRSEVSALPIRIYDGTWAIEEAAMDLATFAKERAEAHPESHPNGPRAMLCVDSLQTVRCETEALGAGGGRDLSEVAAVTARVRAIRAVATRYRLFALVTSELGRSAYRSGDPSQQASIMASAKWSGAVEYSARVLLGLRSVPDEQDLVDLEVAKNKHGPRDEHVFLRIDRRSQTLIPVEYDPPTAAAQQDRDGAARDRVATDAAALAGILKEFPGIGSRDLRAKARARAGIGVERVEAALALLDEYELVARSSGPRGAKPMRLATVRGDRLAAVPDPLRRVIEVAND